jgi:hypothetical protein
MAAGFVTGVITDAGRTRQQQLERSNVNTIRPRIGRVVVAIGATLVLTTAACGDDDDDTPSTSIEVETSDVSETSVVTNESEVTLGTTVSSEVTETTTFTSEVEITEPGVTTSGG